MPNLKVLVVHNRYQQPGGEDAVVRAEVRLLRETGHRVVQYARHNREIGSFGGWRKASLLLTTTWDGESYREISRVIEEVRPDVAHFHNVVPLVSPSAYYACKRAGVVVVQTLHNYRMSCPAGTCFHNDRRCNACRRGLMAAVLSGCYQDSRIHTVALAMMLQLHRAAGTWTRMVDAYIVPSRFSRDFAIDSGLPAQKLHVKPHFLADDPGPRQGEGEYGLFAGRLSAEKGILPLLRAWRKLPHIPLVIVGDGPLDAQARELAEKSGAKHIRFTGQVTAQQTLAHMRKARFLVFPSQCYETFGMALLEAGACGVPAIASRIGAIPELVAPGETGLLFDPGSEDELAAQVGWAWSHPREMKQMGVAARQNFLQRYTPERNYNRLIDIYGAAIAQASQWHLPSTLSTISHSVIRGAPS